MLLKEVGFFDEVKKQDRAYQEIKQPSEEIIKIHEVEENKNFEVLMMKNKINFLSCFGFQNYIKNLQNKDLLRRPIRVPLKIFFLDRQMFKTYPEGSSNLL